MSKKSILFVVAGPEGYGVGRVWDLLFNSLVNHDYQITITVLDRDYLSRWIERYPGASIVAPTFLE